ncbi:hypothetical protein Hanom_Chr04g00350761 [Helianthus anomalus]
MKSVSKRRAENGIRRKIARPRFEDWEVRLVCMLVDVVETDAMMHNDRRPRETWIRSFSQSGFYR